MIKILVADDHFAVRAGMKAVLDREEDMRVLWDASNGTDAVALVRHHPVDLLLLDMRMPDLDGLEVIKVLMNDGHRPRILAFSAFADPDLVGSAMEAGADGYILKDVGIEETVTAVRRVVRGECYLCEAAQAAIGPELYSAMSRKKLTRPHKSPVDIKADVIALELARPTADWPADVRQVHSYLVERAFHDSTTIGDALSGFKIVDRRFASRFRRWVGLSPREKLTEMRLAVGHRLLKSGGKPTEVAMDVGYSSEAAFAMAYKSWFDRTPSADCGRSLR